LYLLNYKAYSYSSAAAVNIIVISLAGTVAPELTVGIVQAATEYVQRARKNCWACRL